MRQVSPSRISDQQSDSILAYPSPGVLALRTISIAAWEAMEIAEKQRLLILGAVDFFPIDDSRWAAAVNTSPFDGGEMDGMLLLSWVDDHG